MTMIEEKRKTISSGLQPLWDLTSEIVLIVDRDGIVLERNSAAERYLPSGLFASFADIVLEHDLILQAIQQAAEQGHPTRVDSLTTKTKGHLSSLLSVQLSPLVLPEDSSDCFLAVLSYESKELHSLEKVARMNEERVEKLRNQLNFVTRELIEKTLKVAEQKNKLDAIIDGMGDGLVAGDESGRIIQYNKTAQSLLLFPEEDVSGQLFTELNPAIAAAIHLDPKNPAAISKQEVNVSFDRKELRVCASPIFDQEKHHFGFVLILQDRTKQAEVDRMKSELISIVSHELRSPLTSIKGYVDLMMTGDLGDVPESMRSYLSIVSSNAGKLAALIDDMLDLSRIESGKLIMSFGKVDIKYLCDYVYLTIKPQAEQKKQQFSLDVDPNVVVSGDVDRLLQVLTNLVSNAIKYTPNGGSIAITAGSRNGKVYIAVKDTGIGISAADRERLFQKFFRVKNDKTANIGGTGLGLCIAESIIKAHNGKILVESEENQGSVFTIELPAFHQ